MLSPSKPVLDSLTDNWLSPNEESLSELPIWTMGDSERLFLFLLVQFLWFEPASECEEEDQSLLWCLALDDLHVDLWHLCEGDLEWCLERQECVNGIVSIYDENKIIYFSYENGVYDDS